MKLASTALLTIQGLSDAAHEHKDRCDRPDCGVSLLWLMQGAKFALKEVPDLERAKAEQIIERMPL